MEDTFFSESVWFIIEPYVFTHCTGDGILLYNTLDGVIIESTDKDIIHIIKTLFNENNCGVCKIEKKELEKDNIGSFINLVREKFMGDIIPISLSVDKPIQLIPILNFQQDKKKLENEFIHSIGENVTTYLHELTIHVNNKYEINIFNWIKFLSKINKIPILNLKINDLNYSLIAKLTNLINENSLEKNIIINYTILLEENIFLYFDNSYIFNIELDLSAEKFNIEQIIQILSEKKRKYKIVFKIYNTEEYISIEKLINKYQIEEYIIQPEYNKNNIDFFKEYIFLSKEDFLTGPTLSFREIFSHQVLNSYEFGKLNIYTNGDIYANPNFIKLGNIKNETIKEVIYKELTEGQSWLRIRDYYPCNNCLYQWICPSPSNYEFDLNKNNLCHIK